jgi:hypothetical protein
MVERLSPKWMFDKVVRRVAGSRLGGKVHPDFVQRCLCVLVTLRSRRRKNSFERAPKYTLYLVRGTGMSFIYRRVEKSG